MTVEFTYLTLVIILTASMWIPYVLNVLIGTVGHPERPKPLAPWIKRIKVAQNNAVENLLIFAALVLVAHVVGADSESIALACIVYFWVRLFHLMSYTFHIPWVSTLVFLAGVLCLFILTISLGDLGIKIVWLPLEQHMCVKS